MTEVFEKKVNSFIEKLLTFDKSIFKRNIFNPWVEFDESDISSEAPKIRTQNLKKYLLNQKNAKYILIAESPSLGARYTGIAMTSEKVINLNNLEYSYTSQKSKNGKYVYELSAKKVWDEILSQKENFVMWNAFAFNIHEKDSRWFENPTEEELKQNLDILNSFLSLYQNAKIITVGATAKNALNILKFDDFESIRHPSNDFKKEFSQQFKKYIIER